jgi:tetratricopeptide (TPR) repeat protein
MSRRPTGSNRAHSSLPDAELPRHARQLLTNGDLAGYGELFAALAGIADPHRRYWAGKVLVEAGLDAGTRASPAHRPALFKVVVEESLGLLEREPAEPVLLGHAGAALRELGSIDAAEAMLEAARRLDPGLAGLDGSSVALRTRRDSTGQTTPPIPELSARAVAIAGRARPADGLRLSLCMIVRDEEEMLPRCLAAMADAVDEIVIVDTGSSDATVEIARSFGARVLTHPWSGSFADARNVSFDAAAGDWVMYLDADEVLVADDVVRLRSLTGRVWREAFSLTEINYTGELHDGSAITHDALRVFRNRPEYRFEGRVHEQIAGCLPGYLPERVEASGVRIEHFGYLGAVRERRHKAQRNLELLRMQQAEGPPTAFLHYNLGSEHAAAGDPVAALTELERSWAMLSDSEDLDAHAFVPALAIRLVRTLRACGLHADAIARAEEAITHFPGFTDLLFEQALATAALGHDERAISLLERCIAMGDAPSRYAASAGCGSHLARIELAGLLVTARRHADAARVLGGVPSEQALPGAAVGALTAMLETLLAAHEFGTFEAILPLFARTPPAERERRELLAAMYLRHGFAASAAEEWMAVCGEQPDVRALLGLARVAVARGMAQEASDFAAAALASDPGNEDAVALLSQVETEAA